MAIDQDLVLVFVVALDDVRREGPLMRTGRGPGTSINL